MSQLTHRTQLLLDDERHRRLKERAEREGRSVGAVIREAIDAHLHEDDEARERLEAGRRLLAAPPPTGYEREPDWEEVKGAAYEERLARWYGADGER